jgi:hypothetical protein
LSWYLCHTVPQRPKPAGFFAFPEPHFLPSSTVIYSA